MQEDDEMARSGMQCYTEAAELKFWLLQDRFRFKWCSLLRTVLGCSRSLANSCSDPQRMQRKARAGESKRKQKEEAAAATAEYKTRRHTAVVK